MEILLKDFDRYLQGMGNSLLIIVSESGIKRIRPTYDFSVPVPCAF